MKITNFAIIFVLIMICIVIPIDIKMNNINAITEKKILYDIALESAIDDAVNSLVEVDTKSKLVLNKEKCIKNFFTSLYANFNITLDKSKQELLRSYLPVILITDSDGYYIYYNDFYQNGSERLITQNFTEKKPYAYEDYYFIYYFTFDDYIKLYDKSTQEIVEGKYADLMLLYAGEMIDDTIFEEIRRATIVNTLIEDMNYYINRHNRIGEHFGFTYNFALPLIGQDDWDRTVDDISMLVIFQGYPYGVGSEIYNRYSISGVRITKEKPYYIQSIDSVLYYHEYNCPLLSDYTKTHDTKKECALEGAYPCLECISSTIY